MNETVAVRVIERLGDLGTVLEDLLGSECAPRDPRAKRFALQILEDQKNTVPVLTEVVNATDVWVLEPGGRLRLAAEPSERNLAAANPLAEDLDRDPALQLGVPSLVDLPHATGCYEFLDPVGPQNAALWKLHERVPSPKRSRTVLYRLFTDSPESSLSYGAI